MGLDRVGSQFRIKVESPSKFRGDSFVTIDPGKKGGLQFVRAVKKKKRMLKKNLVTQSIRVQTKDFKRVKGKLIAKTKRGEREAKSLLMRKKGKIASAIRFYFK